jgi:DNA-binding beta-propeller fold protein YncE
MEHAERFRNDGPGGVRIGDGSEGGPGGDGEEEQSAKPNNDGQPDKSTEQGFHGANRVQRAGFMVLGAAITNQRVIRYSGGAMKTYSALSVLLLFATAGLNAQILLVANQGDRTVSLIDPAAGEQMATVSEGVAGEWGHEITASADGRTAYLPIYGNSGVGKPGIDGQKLLVIDLGSRKVISTIDFGHGMRPHLPVLDPASGMLYVTTELDEAIAEIDPRTLKIVGKVPTGQKESHMLALSRDGKLGYTANVGPGTVSVLDMAGRKTVAVIPVAPIVQRIAISRDDRMVFTSDMTKPRMAVIDTAAKRVRSWVDLPGRGYGSAATLDGKWLLVAIPEKDEVAVVDLGAMRVARTVPVAADPQEILVRPDGRVAYVSCETTGQVAAIDLTQWKVQKLIDAGKGADGLGWAR